MIQIDDIVIDIASSEDHQFDNEVTDHPVETGSNVADNTIAKPLVIVIDGLVSDFPLTGGGLTGTSQPAGGATQSPTPSQYALQKLLALHASRQPITVIDSLGTWPSMVLEKLSVPRTAKTGYALQFRASFKQIVTTTNERTVVPVSLPRAAAKSNLGHKIAASPSAPPAATEDNRTALHKLLSSGSNYVGYTLPGDPGNPIGNSVPEP